ncbi:MAG: hypothetical protein B6I34_06590 [Anaerolineaceae bacterium 4572_32.1]|nr:MAG: hypothetical protein B6I34_06590 [Anaerolineaceae bacterium 4572_32.1]
MKMDLLEFRKIANKALESLPPDFVARLDNVEIVVEDWPSPYVLRLAGVTSMANLLGFYHGVPQTKRTLGYNLTPPDKISLYRRPIEMRCRTIKDVELMVSRVLRHEIAHHFGINDERLQEIGAY